MTKWVRVIPACVVLTALSSAFAAEKPKEIEALVAQYHQFELFNGAVLVADAGEVVYQKGFGPANTEWNIPNASDTKFRLGSITKQFTAAIILQLEAEGKLALADPIGKHLPDYPEPAASKVTVHHLLVHTSGIPSYTSMPEFWKDMVRDPYSPADFIKVFSAKKLDFEPGGRFQYNNSGYFLLGVIIEELTGMSYEDALRKRVLAPLGMNATGYDHHRTNLPKRASGYDRTPDGLVNASYLDMSLPYAAGSLYSTVEDLYKWDQALYTAGVLSQRSRELMFTPHVEMPDPEKKRRMHYGYGWVLETVESPTGGGDMTVIGHGGGINGFNTLIHRLPAERRLIVLLNNTGGAFGLNPLAEGLRAILYDAKPDAPKRPVASVLYETYRTNGATAAAQQLRDLHEKQSDQFDFNPGSILQLAGYLSEQRKTEDGIELLKAAAEVLPQRAQIKMSLAGLYKKTGEKELAVRTYAQVLELAPDRAAQIAEELKEISGK